MPSGRPVGGSTTILVGVAVGVDVGGTTVLGGDVGGGGVWVGTGVLVGVAVAGGGSVKVGVSCGLFVEASADEPPVMAVAAIVSASATSIAPTIRTTFVVVVFIDFPFVPQERCVTDSTMMIPAQVPLAWSDMITYVHEP